MTVYLRQGETDETQFKRLRMKQASSRMFTRRHSRTVSTPSMPMKATGDAVLLASKSSPALIPALVPVLTPALAPAAAAAARQSLQLPAGPESPAGGGSAARPKAHHRAGVANGAAGRASAAIVSLSAMRSRRSLCGGMRGEFT
jgi:hypothetical protein